MKTIEDKKIDQAVELYLAAADKAEDNAAHAGSHNDGGASRMRDLVAAYNCGRYGNVPEWLKPHVVEAARREDPEYTEFVRLQKKFGK